jgi:hypothetical protein
MSDGGRIHRPGAPTGGHEKVPEDPMHTGNSVEADRDWAQNRIANFFRAQKKPIMRKAAGGEAEQAEEAGEEGAKVSQPGEPAEKEADAVADHVADQMHGGDKQGEHGAEAGKEKAPAIGAKLQPGAISLAPKPGANPNQLPLPGMGAKDDKKKDPAKPQRDPKDPKFLQAKARSAPVAAQLQAALEPNQQGRVTIGAGVTEGGALIVATSEGGLRPTVAKAFKSMGAQLAKGAAGVHAEDKIIAHAGKGLVAVAAGRPICTECEDHILGAGALPASACKSGKVY